MKRVSKLALTLAAVVSFLFFLVYKTRYDRLYSVLEVLEFFGQDKVPSNIRSSRRIFHPPSWQRVSDFIYVYSAFCSRTPDSDDVCATVTILAIATQESLGRNDLEKMTCQLWYDSSIQPISVPVTVAETTNREAKVLTCESKYASVMPFGVSLGIPEQKKVSSSAASASSATFQAYLHVEAPIEEKGSKEDILACLAPQDQHVDSTLPTLENVLLHHYLGVDHFHLYDNGITHKFVHTLGQQGPVAFNLSLAIWPWNPPITLTPESLQYLVEMDCHMRAKASGFGTHFVVALSQIVVPKSGANSLKEALKASKKQGQLLVDVLKFCSEYPDDEKSGTNKYIRALRQSIYNTESSQGQSAVKIAYGRGDQHRLSRDEIAVHDYGACNNYDLDVNGAESIKDRTLLRRAASIEKFMGQFFPSVHSKEEGH